MGIRHGGRRAGGRDPGWTPGIGVREGPQDQPLILGAPARGKQLLSSRLESRRLAPRLPRKPAQSAGARSSGGVSLARGEPALRRRSVSVARFRLASSLGATGRFQNLSVPTRYRIFLPKVEDSPHPDPVLQKDLSVDARGCVPVSRRLLPAALRRETEELPGGRGKERK